MDFYQSHRQRIMVSADDFGISPRANRNILYLISLGKINRVGVMVNGNISQKEIEELVKSGVKLDIHLDIRHEMGSKKKRSTFSRLAEFLWKILIRSISQKKVELEWRQQIEKFKALFGKNPDGMNSHEHVHFFPSFFKLSLRLRNEYAIPYLRFGEIMNIRPRTTVASILKLLRIIDKKLCSKDECVSSGSLVSLDWISDLDKFSNNLPEGTIEIVCHPQLAEEFVKIKKYF